MVRATYRRGTWDELVIDCPERPARTTLARAYRQIQRVLDELDGRQGDEHGGWETGCEFDRKKRGSAVNVDLYGLAIVDRQPLGVVQVREYSRTSARQQWARIRKSYFLVGRNEGTGRAFAHPISSNVVRAAIRRDDSPESSVRAAQAWIFEVEQGRLDRVVRHGDCALVQCRSLPGGARDVEWSTPAAARLQDSHWLVADQCVRVGDRLYARDATLTHRKGQHADITVPGWSRVQIGLRADYYRFASPTAD